MIVSARPLTLSARWAQAFVLLVAAAALPVGVAHAQEPDYEAVGDRLLEAVEEGELSPDQAEAMMGELARAHFKQRLEALRAEEDEHEDDDRGDEWEGIAKRFEHLGMPPRRFWGMVEQLGKAGLKKDQFVPAVGGMLKLVYVLKEEGGAISKEEGKAFNHHFQEHDLNEKQIDMVWGMAKRFAARLRKDKKAPSREEMGKVKEKIWSGVKAGKLTEAQAKQRWEGYLKSVRGGKKKPKREKTAGLADPFENMGVDMEALGKAKDALVEAGVKGQTLEQALGGMLRVVHAAKEQGEKFELDPKLREYFAKQVGLTAKQIDLVVGLARRLAYSAKKGTKQY